LQLTFCIGERQKLKAQKMSEAQKIIESTNVEVSTSVLPFANTLLAPVFSTAVIQKMVCEMEVLRFNLPCENVKYLFSDWEIDVLSMNKNDYLTEYEVKVSRSDFKADAKKKKWQWYEKRIETMISNYFYYTCPEGLILENEIPAFAGLIYATNEGLKVIKKAPLLHKKKHDRVRTLSKFCRVMSERSYLGSCRLTYENAKRKRS
jgi:hypothetical protein